MKHIRLKRSGICPLCKTHKDLVHSHGIPAGVTRSMQEKSDNETPLSITASITLSTSRQFQDFVFCLDCEDKLNRGGESWVIANMARSDTFLLFDALMRARYVRQYEDGYVFETADSPDIDTDKLAYFGLSMFWRLSVHDWQGIDGFKRRLGLDDYQEPIRLFLDGTGPFPSDVVMGVSVWPNKDAVQHGTYLPRLDRTEPYHIYSYYLPGISFIMHTGSEIDQETRDLCCYAGPGNPVFTSGDVAGRTDRFLAALARNSRPSRSLLRKLTTALVKE
jgi:hypothetical protein